MNRSFMKNATNPALGVDAISGWADRLMWSQRRKLFDAFVLFRQGAADDTVLEVGLSAGRAADGLHAWSDAPNKSVVTACTLDPCAPDLRLPYPERAFDWVYCAEVIEHAGSCQQQQALVAECYRVARKGVFITTPNRRHPVDFNSALPFVHWLPQPWRRRILQWSGRERWAGLALLAAPQLYALAAALPGTPAHDVGHKRVCGIKAHFFLMIQKGA